MKNVILGLSLFCLLNILCHNTSAQWVDPGADGTDEIYYNGGNVGIGISTPSEMLQINGNIRGNQSGAIRIKTPSGWVDIGPKSANWAHFQTDRPRIFLEKPVAFGAGLFGSYSTFDLKLTTGMGGTTDGLTRMIILNSNGNVGINTLSPAEKFHVVGNAQIEDTLKVQTLQFIGDGSYANSLSDISLWNQNAQDISFLNGNVGIGTDSPTQLLTLSESNEPVLRFDRSDSSAFDWEMYSTTGGLLNFRGGADRSSSQLTDFFTLDQYGNVGIGTQTPSQKLEVVGNAQILDTLKVQTLEFLTDGGTINSLSDFSFWSQSGSDIHYLDGKVGIGTDNPSTALEVSNQSAVAPFSFKIDPDQRYLSIDAKTQNGLASQGAWPGIAVLGDAGSYLYLESDASEYATGTDTKGSLFISTLFNDVQKKSSLVFGTVNGSTNESTGSTLINIDVNDGSAGTDIASIHASNFQWKFDGSEVMRVNAAGQVGIGTSDVPAEYTLAVGGAMIAERVKVQLQADWEWPDYVFAETYKIKSLEDLSEYIKEHEHLPGIPSAKEVKKEGIDIGSMNAMLLKKIEELTLYTIQQQNIIIHQAEEMNELKKQVDLIVKQIYKE